MYHYHTYQIIGSEECKLTEQISKAIIVCVSGEDCQLAQFIGLVHWVCTEYLMNYVHILFYFCAIFTLTLLRACIT